MIENNCGWRHLKLVALIVSIVIVIVGSVFGVTWNMMNGHEERLRVVEERSMRIDERLKAMQASLERIEKGIED